MTGKEIIEKLKELNITPYKWDREIGDWYGSGDDKTKMSVLELTLKNTFGTWVCVKDKRVNEYYEVVLHFIEHNIYISTSGNYDSWNGIDWDYSEWIEVVPVEKTIIVYRSKID